MKGDSNFRNLVHPRIILRNWAISSSVIALLVGCSNFQEFSSTFQVCRKIIENWITLISSKSAWLPKIIYFFLKAKSRKFFPIKTYVIFFGGSTAHEISNYSWIRYFVIVKKTSQVRKTLQIRASVLEKCFLSKQLENLFWRVDQIWPKINLGMRVI